MLIVGTKDKEKVDENYRYKMVPIIGKKEGRGNGKKTAIPNCSQLARQLHRTPGAFCKFFGNELGAVSTWDPEVRAPGKHGNGLCTARACVRACVWCGVVWCGMRRAPPVVTECAPCYGLRTKATPVLHAPRTLACSVRLRALERAAQM